MPYPLAPFETSHYDAARDLWQDRTIIPVRGQTGWLVPQSESRYGLRFANMSVLSKADGMVVMTWYQSHNS